jgi:class 3 adenylate cyclase/tetratricopeptide (TPR) repeat protein
VTCSACGFDNPARVKFCGSCGRRLAAGCPSCGAGSPPGFRFCAECGRPLVPGERPAPDPRAYTPKHLAEKILGSRSALEGERKQVTVLFADVKGSMDLAEQLDPEDWHRIMDRFFQLLAEGVHRFEGTVNQYTGDGIMALFGAPIAHEDHARRACYAALYLQDELGRYSDTLRLDEGLNFSVRMGLNSGEVVVGTIGDDLRMDYTAQGHTVGLAARMEQIAAPGRTYLTEHTARLVTGFFRLADLGPSTVKGAREPVRVYALEGVGSVRTRLEVAGARGFSRFVGREAEMASLETALGHALEGNGQIVGVVADAGTGKSRLCYEFSQRCRARGVGVYEAHGVAHGKLIPLLPILEIMRAYFGVSEQDSDEQARRKIAGTVLLLDKELTDDVPLLLDFLGVPDPEHPVPRMDPEARQRRLLGIVKGLIDRRSRREPAVLLMEDLHWFDEASLVFVEGTVEALPGTRTLLLLNFRPEYRAAWTQLHYHQLPLLPLGPEAIADLLRDLLGADPSVVPLVDRIRERTGGNPFFIEEVVQSLIEARCVEGTRGSYRLVGPIADVVIPSTVQVVLDARIDRLPEREKMVLKTAAVIGKEFGEPILKRVVDLPEAELGVALRALTGAEFLYEEALYPEAVYAFKHPLTQEAAYRSQLGERRARVHTAVARATADLYRDKLDERAALLAHHWEAAGDALESARWNRRAAEWVRATDLSAALGHWRRVLVLLGKIPESEETIDLGIAARMMILGLGWIGGISSDENDTLFAEGKELASRSGNMDSLAVLLAWYHDVRISAGGAVTPALEAAAEVVRLAGETDDPSTKLAVRIFLIARHYEAGRLREALTYDEQALEEPPADLMTGFVGVSPYIWCVMFRGLLLTDMGRLDDATQEFDRAFELARAHGDFEVLAQTHSFSSLRAWLEGDDQAALGQAHHAVEIAEKIGSAFSRVLAYASLGDARMLRGESAAAVDAFERALAIGQDRRTARQAEAGILALLAEARCALGDFRWARETAGRALAMARERGMRKLECMAHLALARVLLRDEGRHARDAIEAALAQALGLVDETGAKRYAPFIHVERAELARLDGDEAVRRRELREAHRLFTEMGARARAELVAKELGL